MVRYGAPIRAEEGEGARTFQQRIAGSFAQLWAEEEMGWYQSLRASTEGSIALPTGPKAAGWRRHWESTRPLRADRPTPAWRDE